MIINKDFLFTKSLNDGECLVCEAFEKAKQEKRQLSEHEIEVVFAKQDRLNFAKKDY